MARRRTNVIRPNEQASLLGVAKPTSGLSQTTARIPRGSLTRCVRCSCGGWRQDVRKELCVDWGDLHLTASVYAEGVGVRGVIVAMTPGKLGGAKDARKVDVGE